MFTESGTVTTILLNVVFSCSSYFKCKRNASVIRMNGNASVIRMNVKLNYDFDLINYDLDLINYDL